MSDELRDALERVRQIAIQSEVAPLSMGEIIRRVDMALGEHTPLPDWMMKPINEPEKPEGSGGVNFQGRVHDWILECFGPEIGADREERNHRFLEEALELVQANGCTRSEAHQLVDYVFSRPVGDCHQEVGGVMNTLAALCTASGLDLEKAAEDELARVWTKVEKIRAKQAAKPRHSPLPEASRASGPYLREAVARALCWAEGFNPDSSPLNPVWRLRLPEADAAIAVVTDRCAVELEERARALRTTAEETSNCDFSRTATHIECIAKRLRDLAQKDEG